MDDSEVQQEEADYAALGDDSSAHSVSNWVVRAAGALVGIVLAYLILIQVIDTQNDNTTVPRPQVAQEGTSIEQQRLQAAFSAQQAIRLIEQAQRMQQNGYTSQIESLYQLQPQLKKLVEQEQLKLNLRSDTLTYQATVTVLNGLGSFSTNNKSEHSCLGAVACRDEQWIVVSNKGK